MGIGNFLHQLLPKDFCMEDLMVVLLLLLMSGNGEEDQNFALLTLGLYLSYSANTPVFVVLRRIRRIFCCGKENIVVEW